MLLTVLSSAAYADDSADNCLIETASDGFGAEVVDDFLSQNGLAEKPADVTGRMRIYATICVDKFNISDGDKQDYMQANLANLMMAENERRLLAVGTDMDALKPLIIASIPNVDTPYEAMMAAVSPALEREVERLVASEALDEAMAIALLGSYTGFVHTGLQSRRRIDAKQ